MSREKAAFSGTKYFQTNTCFRINQDLDQNPVEKGENAFGNSCSGGHLERGGGDLK